MPSRTPASPMNAISTVSPGSQRNRLRWRSAQPLPGLADCPGARRAASTTARSGAPALGTKPSWQGPEKSGKHGIDRFELLEAATRDDSVIGSFELSTFSVPFAVFRYFQVADVRQWLAGRAA